MRISGAAQAEKVAQIDRWQHETAVASAEQLAETSGKYRLLLERREPVLQGRQKRIAFALACWCSGNLSAVTAWMPPHGPRCSTVHCTYTTTLVVFSVNYCIL